MLFCHISQCANYVGRWRMTDFYRATHYKHKSVTLYVTFIHWLKSVEYVFKYFDFGPILVRFMLRELLALCTIIIDFDLTELLTVTTRNGLSATFQCPVNFCNENSNVLLILRNGGEF